MATRSVEALYDHWPKLTQSKFNEIMLDFEQYCEKGSIIIDKNGIAVPFKLNKAQRLVSQAIITEVFHPTPSPTNVFIHKSRQMGISVVIAKLEQYIATRVPNINAQHFMPTEDDADDLFEKKFIPLMQGSHPDCLPKTHKTERRLKFMEFGGVNLGSSVTFSTSQSQAGSRGQTNQIVIEDEQAFYERITSFERGVLATMPRTGRALRVVVSTANGMNHFYDTYKVAKDSPHWKYMFLPWHMLDEYEMEPQGRLKELTELTEYELFLCDVFEEHGYPVQKWASKMQWYDYTLQTEAKNVQDHMFENYPSTPEESFSATGSPVLPAIKIREQMMSEVKPEFIEVSQDVTGKVALNRVVTGTIRKFKEPVKGHKYIFGCDPAEGGEEGDFSAAVMIDLSTMENVLSIKEKLDQNDFAELVSHIGKYYNNATIIVERNTGQSMIDWLKILKYPRIYIDALHTTYSKVQYGVYMTRPLKNEAILRAKFLYLNNIYHDYDSEYNQDALHFVWKKTPSGMKKAIAESGHSDDTVLARLIAFATLDMRQWKNYQQEKQDAKDR